MRITWRQFRPGIANPYDGFVVKLIHGDALFLKPGAIDDAIFTGSGKPMTASKFFIFHRLLAENAI